MSGLNAAHFLKQLDGVITGSGFKRVLQGVNINTVKADGGLILTASTNPRRTAVGNFDVLASNTSDTDLGRLVFNVPRDYDQSLDSLKIRFLAQSAGDDDTPTIDAAIYRKREGVALSSDLDPTISGAVSNNTSLADYVEIDCSDLGMKPGDALNVVLTTSAHTSDVLHIYSLEVVYKSDLVYFSKTDRS